MKVWALGDAVIDLIPFKCNMKLVLVSTCECCRGCCTLRQNSGFIGRVGEEALGILCRKPYLI